jgi:subfamily B ATP-binding cassette protein MsbA
MMKDKHYVPMTDSIPLITRLLKVYVRPQSRDISLSLALMLVASAMTGAMAQLMEPIIDKVFTARNSDMLLPVALAVLAVFSIRGMTTYGYTVLLNKVGQRIVSTIKNDMFSHLIYADVAFFHRQQSGEFQSRFLSDVYMIRGTLNDALAGMGKNFFTLLFLLGVMFKQDWKLSLVSIFVFPAAGYIVARLGRRLRKVSINMQSTLGEMTAMLGQAFQGNKHIKAYGMEEFEKKRIGGIVENVFNLVHKSFKVSSVATPVAEILSGFAVVAIVLYGGHQVMEGTTTAGKLFSFIAAFLMAFEPMKRLARLNSSTQQGLAAADRLFHMLDTTPTVKDKPDAEMLVLQNPTVVFEDVHFSYADGTEALTGLSFSAPAGKTIALVGESGAGKSTILNLIPRFYDVTGGAIRIDGNDVRDVTLSSLRGNMALVSQDVAIFNDTVRDNIAYGSPQATDAQIEEAAKSAVAHDFIMELQDGYDTFVGENGVKLSGGQRQRIAIARAMLRNAPILLLDEATSALDANSERLVQTALDRLQAGKTTIVVAHRLSTIMNADIIYVMAGGKIIETGDHTSLIAQKGTYARLYGSLTKETA